VALYDSVSAERTGDLKTSEFFGTAIAISHNNAYLAVGNNNGGLFIFNREKDNSMLKFQLHHKQIRSIAFTEDSSKLISGCDDQSVKVFDIESEEPIAELSGHKLGVTCVDTHPTDSKIILSSSFDKSIKLWDIRTKHASGNIQHHPSAVWSAKFSSSGKFIASGGESGLLAIHSLK
jgi:WD40 repeat protein